jgi:hypothetical protein
MVPLPTPGLPASGYQQVCRACPPTFSKVMLLAVALETSATRATRLRVEARMMTIAEAAEKVLEWKSAGDEEEEAEEDKGVTVECSRY